jgi:hypothetical protein
VKWILVEKNAEPFVHVTVKDETLVLGLHPTRTNNMINVTLRAQIAPPELTELALGLSSEVDLGKLAGLGSSNA